MIIVLFIIFKGYKMFIHGAAVTHTFNEMGYYNINLNGTKNLVDIANPCQVKGFVSVSSNTAGIKSGAY
jgi:nucleoside-diphosphate-sugar epimerase